LRASRPRARRRPTGLAATRATTAPPIRDRPWREGLTKNAGIGLVAGMFYFGKSNREVADASTPLLGAGEFCDL
jgi:hypothetical protein